MLDITLRHLEALVAFDTRNPPRAIGREGIFAYLQAQLPGFTHTLTDHGAGAVSLLSVRGAPRTVFNFHLDTVPASASWTRDPLRLAVAHDRAVGLGACDIKGGAAAMLAAAQRSSGPVALLFSSDEEANDARCIAAYLRAGHPYARVVVAEPTQAQAVCAHRGIASVQLDFVGIAGHASQARALSDSAVHRAVDWAQHALSFARAQQAQQFGALQGLPFNIGRIDGGIKGNIIADACTVRVGLRPLPAQSLDALLGALRGMASPRELARFEVLFRGPALPARSGEEGARQLAAGQALAHELGLPLGAAVDFWTEASLFSDAGLTALVFGPGDIAQAHTADEWVALSQLDAVARHYARMIAHGV
jgi:acetylornithine deacetylase